MVFEVTDSSNSVVGPNDALIPGVKYTAEVGSRTLVALHKLQSLCAESEACREAGVACVHSTKHTQPPFINYIVTCILSKRKTLCMYRSNGVERGGNLCSPPRLGLSLATP